MDKQDDNESATEKRLSTASYEKVSLISHAESGSSDDDAEDDHHDDDEEHNMLRRKSPGGLLRRAGDNVAGGSEDSGDDDNGDNNEGNLNYVPRRPRRAKKRSSDFDPIDVEDDTTTTPTYSSSYTSMDILHKTLLPDKSLSFRGMPILEGTFTVKLLKFIFWTFALVTVMHVLVGKLFDDRDRSLKLWHIWVFDGELMVRDMVVFFVVGRLWRQQGIDHLAFVGTALMANVYFEFQNFIPFLQHSVTLYQMHCIWPWTLWLFALVLIPSIGALVAAHVIRAYRKGVLVMKLAELSLCFFFFVAPLLPSNYFHLHHWYAGWLLGMHANFDVWWSRFAMAWCWGMYINGIAVYGRDPVLTCEYAYFLTLDNHCPYVNCYLQALEEMRKHPQNHTESVVEMVPINWMNCSAEGFVP